MFTKISVTPALGTGVKALPVCPPFLPLVLEHGRFARHAPRGLAPDFRHCGEEGDAQ